MTVWVFVVSGFLTVGGQQAALIGQGRTQILGRFVFPSPEVCEAARDGVREFAQSANQTLIIGRCTEEAR
jgi:hypothetical protein